MSADNWIVCPKCREEAKAQKVSARKLADESYGKVSQEEYLQLKENADAYSHAKIEETLRENYEFSLFDGFLDMNYDALCNVCGFEFHYHKRINIFTGKEITK